MALSLLALFLSACGTPEIPVQDPVSVVATPTPPEALPGRVVISEFVPGVPGNNNFEFIELYNAGTQAVDLRGWSIWYRFDESQEPQRLYLWSAATDLPGYGHYLLARTGADVSVWPDAHFDMPLFERKGGLVLRDASGSAVDALGWGDAPADFREGTAAAPPQAGESLERLPGGIDGSGADGDDNAADFRLNPQPDPQNRGSAMTPLPERRLEISASAPVSVTPGSTFDYHVTIANRTGVPLDDLRVVLPLPERFSVVDARAQRGEISAAPTLWTLPRIEAGAQLSATLALQAPWRYEHVSMSGHYVESSGWPLRSYGPSVPLTVAGGAIPISVARTLTNEIVTVEGVATMFTGGFFAGTTGTKFYIEDETGGIQVYCPGGSGVVVVGVGERVRVTGKIELYRDSVEIIPGTYATDVEMLGAAGLDPAPVAVTCREANTDPQILGRLVSVEGVATRIEEFSYSYEVDLLGDDGETVMVYLEKDTGADVEMLEVGNRYRVMGISELYNAQWQVKPRRQDDFVRVYPPELMIEVLAQNSAAVGEAITYTITAYNHTPYTLTNVEVVTVQPNEGAEIDAVLDGGLREGGAIAWTIPALAPGGGSFAARYRVRVTETATDRVVMPGAIATADQWPEAVESQTWVTFVGSGVPVWAIQGAGTHSPYVHSLATTEGIVTGVFPDLEGFWIQGGASDDDPATSEGLFVYAPAFDPGVAVGDRVLVTGKVREKSGQTLLQPGIAANVTILASGDALPDAVELNPPVDDAESLRYFEALEGMLVQVREPARVVAPVTRYGEYALVRSDTGIDRIMRGDPRGALIFVDDGSAVAHEDGGTLPYLVKSGDLVGDLVGPLAYTYGNYKIEPIVTPTVQVAAVALPALAPPAAHEVSVATFNAENLFDFQSPNPADPPMPSLRQYRTRLEKLAHTIVAMGAPTIVGLQEIENVGVLEDVAEQEILAAYGYRPFLIEGMDSRGIDVGFLVRGEGVTVDGVAAYPAPEGLTSRPPLLITATVELPSGPQTFYVINNHFTSMSGGEGATEPQRKGQAAWNVRLVEQILARDPGAYVVVMGDLNSYYRSPPLDVLREGGLRHVYESLPEDARPYTYIYQGESETLDHLLVSPALFERLARVTPLHVNADYPLALPDDTSSQHLSDHDPLVAVFAFPQ